MAILTAVSDTTIARSHRVIGVVNLALALVCIAAPAIRSSIGAGMALLLTVGLLMGAELTFTVARCFDPRPRTTFAMLGHSIRQLGARRVAIAA